MRKRNVAITNQTRPVVADPSEWRVLHETAGLADLSGSGRLRIEGADALDLLNRLTTNKLETLPSGTARDTVLANGDGRVVDFLALAALPDHLLCLTSPGRAQVVVDWLDTYTFGEDITVRDVTGETAQMALAGPGARDVLAEVSMDGVPEAKDTVLPTRVGGKDVVLWRTLPGGAHGFLIISTAEEAASVRSALAAAGAVPVADETWQAYRIANGLPVYGAELSESVNPLEARLRGAISDDKGCYTGQEVIARLQTYRKVQRRLMAVDLEGVADPGTELTSSNEEAGVLTSVAVLPGGRCTALAMVPMKLAVEGVTVTAGNVRGVLREPPYAVATEPVE